MKKYLLISILSLSCSAIGQNCSMLNNGKYETKYDGNEAKSTSFEINNNHYIFYEQGVRKEYKIKMLSDCNFELENETKVDESKLTESQKILSKQKSYFEITKVEGNIYYFVCKVDLHIQCGSGKFIRKE